MVFVFVLVCVPVRVIVCVRLCALVLVLMLLGGLCFCVYYICNFIQRVLEPRAPGGCWQNDTAPGKLFFGSRCAFFHVRQGHSQLYDIYKSAHRYAHSSVLFFFVL